MSMDGASKATTTKNPAPVVMVRADGERCTLYRDDVLVDAWIETQLTQWGEYWSRL